MSYDTATLFSKRVPTNSVDFAQTNMMFQLSGAYVIEMYLLILLKYSKLTRAKKEPQAFLTSVVADASKIARRRYMTSIVVCFKVYSSLFQQLKLFRCAKTKLAKIINGYCIVDLYFNMAFMALLQVQNNQTQLQQHPGNCFVLKKSVSQVVYISS